MPGIYYGDNGANRMLKELWYGDNGTNRKIVEAWYGDSGVNRRIWPPEIVIAGSASYSAYAEDRVSPYDSSRLMSVAPSLAVSGADGNYTVSWAFLSGTAMTVSNPAALNPQFSRTVLSNQTVTATYRVTVTSAGLTATKDVFITLTFESGVPI